MPKLDKALKRDKKIHKRKHGHVIDNKGIFILEEMKIKRANKEKAKRKKQRIQEKEEELASVEKI